MMRKPASDLNHSAEYGHVRDSSIRGAGAGVTSVVTQFAIRSCSMVVLARLLVPEDFGLVALAGISLNLFVRVADLGLTTASTQRHTVDLEELSTLFWINVGGGVVLAGLMMASAPLLSAIFDEPRVERVVIVLSVVLAVMGMGAQHESLMRRRLDFRRLVAVDPISQAMGAAAGIIAASGGLGYWSIVLMNVVTRLSTTIAYWIGARWIPGPPNPVRSMLSFLRLGGSVAGSQSLIYIAHNLDSIVMGAVGGVGDLGLYRRGYNLLHLPVIYCKAQMDRMMLASLSRLQDNYEDFSRLYVHGVTALVFVGCPAIGLMVAESPAIITVILGDKWIGTVPFLRWLAPAALIGFLEVCIVWLMIPLGEGRKLLVVHGIRVTSIAVGLIIGQRWGTIGIAAGYGLASVGGFAIEMVYASAGRIKLMRSVLDGIWRPIWSAIVAMVVVLSIKLDPSIVTVAIEATLYAMVYLGVHVMLPGGLRFLRKATRVLRSLVNQQGSGLRSRVQSRR